MRTVVVGIVLLVGTLIYGDGPSRPVSHTNTVEIERCAAGERQIGSGETHICGVWLDEGDLLRSRVTQLGADVATTVRDPDGAPVLRVDYPGARSGSEEPLYFLARMAGRHLLEIALADRATADQRYRLDLWPPRLAEGPDIARASGTAAFARGRRLARDARRQGRSRDDDVWQTAHGVLEQAIEHWRVTGNRAQAAFAWEELARVRDDQERHDAAFEAHERAYRGFSDADHPRLIRVAHDFGDRALGRHRPELALTCFQQRRRAAQRWGTPLDEISALEYQAEALKRLGREDEALNSYEKALELWRLQSDPAGRAGTLTRIGRLFTAIGEHQRAIGFLDAALSIQKRLKNPAQTAFTLNVLGDAERRLRRIDASLRYFARSLNLLQSGSGFGKSACVDRGIALLGKARGQAAKRKDRPARAFFERALEQFAACRRPGQEAVALGGLGLFYVDSGRPRVGLEHLEKALDLHQSMGEAGLGGQASAHYALARAYLALADLPRASDQVRQAIELVEARWQSKRSPALRSAYLNSKQRYYDLYVEILMGLGEDSRTADYEAHALEVSGRRRARTLSERLRASTESLHPRDPDLRRREDALWRDLIALEQQLDRTLDVTGRSQEALLAEAKLQRLYVRYDTFEAEARQRAPSYRARHRSPLLREIQGLLDEDTTLLEFSLGERSSFVWRVSRNDFSAHRLAPREVLEDLARQTHKSLSDSSRSSFHARRRERILTELVNNLLPPALVAELSTERLALVKDGALHFIPFAVLPVPAGHPRRGYDAREPLVTAHEIVNLPAAGILQQLRKKHRRRESDSMDLAVFADAAYTRGNVHGSRLEERQSVALSVGEESYVGNYRQLDATRDEGQAILRLAPGDSRGFFGTDVHRDAVLRQVEGPEYLHFAVHGYSNPIRPEHSGLVLSRFDPQGREIASLLSAREIHRLSLTAELAVLSSCGSGLGRQVRGEGLVGLTQAFLGAGTRQVVVSLWDVSDRGTSIFMQRFYAELFSHHRSAAAALRATQIWMSHQTRWQEPRFWAGFVLHGDWR